ncbi:hypothetical protein F2Q69_00008153 [Brassica cretica]|uniref:Single-stranded DNA binding protein Ssb-like OB fold domain-containing protein n=1 Tax=Brassica cretica TaxID=69181 RepID=A0A8S9NVQ5_BRACR|nr:hypothetical protein F2Q69_00008153 [Brassica cretica]
MSKKTNPDEAMAEASGPGWGWIAYLSGVTAAILLYDLSQIVVIKVGSIEATDQYYVRDYSRAFVCGYVEEEVVVPVGPQARQMRIAECLVGDETGIIIFTATSKVRIHYICTHIHIRNLFAFMAAIAYLLKV